MKFLLMLTLGACNLTPSYVDTIDIDQASSRSAWNVVCKGLEMKEDRIRQYATQQLWKMKAPAEEQACICTEISTHKYGWDPAIAAGLVGTKDDNIVSCFADLIGSPDITKQKEAVVALSLIAAPISRKTLAGVAIADGDIETRVAAAKAIGGDPLYKDNLMTLLGHEESALRAIAAEGLAGHKDKAVIAALVKSATDDKDGAVRAKALVSVKSGGSLAANKMVCQAMLEDPSPAVRTAAVLSFRGTKRNSAIECLKARAMAKEDDPGVRQAILDVLKSSPNDNAAKLLCDAIPFWMRSYVKDDIPDKIPGTMIVKAQNDRDWERSYDCFQRAYRQSSGYSCFAKMHVGLWFREVGGKPYVPSCPGYENKDKK